MPGTRPSLLRSSAIAVTSTVLAAAFVLTGCSSSTSKTASSGTSSSGGAQPKPGSSAAPVHAGGGQPVAGTGFCREATLAQAAQTKAANAFTVGSPGSLQKIEQQGLTELRALTATAPSQIKSSLASLVAADEKLYSALQAANFDMRKVDPTALTSLNTPEFTKSMQTIEGYLTSTCGIKVTPSA